MDQEKRASERDISPPSSSPLSETSSSENNINNLEVGDGENAKYGEE